MSRSVLIAHTAVGQYAFFVDASMPGWQMRLAADTRSLRLPANWAVIPIPDGHGPRKVVTP